MNKIIMIMLLATTTLFADDKLKLDLNLETGFLYVLDHEIQFGKEGTLFNYKDDGGQDVLFNVNRLQVGLSFAKNHNVIFLYQPLELNTKEVLYSDLVVDNTTFETGETVNFRYSFPYYRISYLYDFVNSKKHTYGAGLSMQLRNASIEFENSTNTKFSTSRNVGLVPLLKVKGRSYVYEQLWLEVEADGAYAPVSYLNGDDNEVLGALLDASFKTGYTFDNKEFYVNTRYIGGGAEGTSDNDTGPGDGYNKNWLNFFNVSLGFTYSIN